MEIGSLNISALDEETPEIGLYIVISEQGHGAGTQAIRLGLEYLAQVGYKTARAKIKQNNISSIRAFEKNGFIKIGEENYLQYYQVQIPSKT